MKFAVRNTDGDLIGITEIVTSIREDYLFQILYVKYGVSTARKFARNIIKYLVDQPVASAFSVDGYVVEKVSG